MDFLFGLIIGTLVTRYICLVQINRQAEINSDEWNQLNAELERLKSQAQGLLDTMQDGRKD